MRFFQKLADRFRPAPQPTGRANGLTDAQFLALKRLSMNEDYRVWQEVLDQRAIILGEQFLSASDPFSLAVAQGTIKGARLAGSLVDEALLHEAHADAERRNRQQPERRNESARKSALFGTPAGSTVFQR